MATMEPTLSDPIYKTYVGKKIRDAHPEIKDATDDEAIYAYVKSTGRANLKGVALDRQLNYDFPPPVEPKQETGLEKTLKALPDKNTLITGATAALVGGLAAAAHFKGKEAVEHTAPAVEKSVAPELGKIIETPKVETPTVPTAPVIPVTPVEPPQPVTAQLASEGAPVLTTAPIRASASHAYDDVMKAGIAKLTSDPNYLKDLEATGGGRTITHTETIREAINRGSMSLDELQNWKPTQPVDAPDIVRANFLRTYHWNKYVELIDSDPAMATQIHDTVLRPMEIGYDNMVGQPGRSLEAMKMFKLNEVADRVAQLEALNLPEDTRKKLVAQLLKNSTEDVKQDPRWRQYVSAVEDYATAAKLANIVTHLNNSISNLGTFFQRAGEKVLASGALRLQGHGAEADVLLKYVFPTMQGVYDAAARAKEIWKGDLEDLGKTEIHRDTKVTVAKPIFRALEAADVFWKTIIETSEMNTKVHLQAMREGLEGDALWSRMQEMLDTPVVKKPETPTQELVNMFRKESRAVAKEYTFQQDPDMFLKGIQHIQNAPGMRLVLPFVKTPYNLTRFYAGRSVFGVVNPRFLRDLKSPDAVVRAEAIGRLGIGIGMTAGALAAASMGSITGAYPSNAKERAAWQLEGKRAWSVHLPFGNDGKGYWLTYNRVLPLGAYLMTAAAVKTALEEGNYSKAENKWGKMLNQIVRGPLDVPFLQGLSTMMEWTQNSSGDPTDLAKMILTGFFPTFLRDVVSQMDPTQRKPSNLTEAMELLVPGMSGKVPARVDALGNIVYAPNRNTPLANLRYGNLFSPAMESDKTKMFDALGWAPPTPDNKLTQFDQSVELHGKEWENYQVDMGKAANYVITRLMEKPEFHSAPPAKKIEKLRTNVTELQKRITRLYKVKNGLYDDYTKDPAAIKREAEDDYAIVKAMIDTTR